MSILCGRYVCVGRRGACIKNAQHFCLLMCLGLGIFLALKVVQRRMRMRMWTIWKVRGASLSGSHCRELTHTRTRTQGHTLTQGHGAALRAKQTELLLQLQLQARQRRRCCGHIRNLLQSELCSRISLDSERERVLEAVSLVKLENCRATKPDQQHSSNIFLWVNSFAQCNSKSFAHTDIHVEPSEPDEEQPEGQF